MISTQKDNIDFAIGDGKKLAEFPEVVEFDRRMCDAWESATGETAYRTIRRAERPITYDLEGANCGFNGNISFGFEAWMQLHLE